jgi:hypothetical protein
MTTRRVVMRNGGMTEIIETTEEEKEVSQRLSEIDSWMLSMREKVRHGKKLNLKDIETPAVSGN